MTDYAWWKLLWNTNVKPVATGVAYQVKKNAWKFKLLIGLVAVIIVAYLYRSFK